MAHTHTWNSAFEALPADPENISLGAGRIRTLKEAVSERMLIDHVWLDSIDTDGEHTKVTFNAPLGVKPTLTGTKGAIYTKTTGGITELFFEDDGGQEVQITEDGAVKELNLTGETPHPPGFLYGLGLANSGGDSDHDLVISTGQCRNDDDDDGNMTLSSSLTKQLDNTWAAGTNQGMLDGGTISSNTTYHIFIISKADDTTDILASSNLASPTMPTDYVNKRRIGSVITDSSANIIAFTQYGDKFMLDTPILDHSTLPSTSGELIDLSVPSDIEVMAHVSSTWYKSSSGASTGYLRLSSPNETDDAASSSLHTGIMKANSEAGITGGCMNYADQILTNTSGQIRARVDVTFTSVFTIFCRGWTDDRGRI